MEGLPIVRYFTPRSHKMDTNRFIYRLTTLPPTPAGSKICRRIEWYRASSHVEKSDTEPIRSHGLGAGFETDKAAGKL
jgi:hypothetical protein